MSRYPPIAVTTPCVIARNRPTATTLFAIPPAEPAGSTAHRMARLDVAAETCEDCARVCQQASNPDASVT
jgi:hypothetical protein